MKIFKEFAETMASLLRDTAKTTKDIGGYALRTYLSLLKNFFLLSFVYVIVVCIIFWKFSGSMELNSILILGAGAFAIGWLILLLPITTAVEFFPARVRQLMHKKKRQIMMAATMALSASTYFSIVDISRSPSTTFGILALWMALTLVYIMKHAEVNLRALEIKIIASIVILTIYTYNPNLNKELAKFAGSLETVVAKVTQEIVESANHKQVRKEEPRPEPRKQLKTFQVENPSPIKVEPEPEQIVIAEPTEEPADLVPAKQEEIQETVIYAEAPVVPDIPKITPPPPPPTLVPLMPQDLQEFRRSYRTITRSRHNSREYRSQVDVLRINEHAALATLEMNIKKALVPWAKHNGIKIIESSRRLDEMEREMRIGRRKKVNPLDDAETADFFLMSSIGFRAQEVSRKAIGEDIDRLLQDILPRKAKRVVRNMRGSGYEEVTIALEVLVTTYIYNQERVLVAVADGSGFVETKIKQYKIGGIYDRSSQNDQFILAAIETAAQNAISKLVL